MEDTEKTGFEIQTQPEDGDLDFDAAPTDETSEDTRAVDSERPARAADEGRADSPPPPTSDATRDADTAQEPKEKLLAGKYRTQEELERAYLEEQRRLTEVTEAKSRVERLLETAVGGMKPAERGEPARPATPAEKRRAFRELMSKVALGEDEELDDDQIVEAMLPALVPRILQHPEINLAMAQAILNTRQYESQKQDLRSAFFEANPHLKDVPPKLLKQLADETDAELREKPDFRGLARQDFVQRVLDETAKRAEQVFNRQRPGPGNGAGNGQPPARGARPSRSGIFSETGGGARPGGGAKLTGQDAELAEVFGGH